MFYLAISQSPTNPLLQRHLCGASDEAVDLLSTSANIADEIRDNRVRRDAAGSGGAMSDASVTRFDGSSGLDLPAEAVAVRPESFPGQMFTISTWMRHAEREDGDNHVKEHIVCEADDHGRFAHLTYEEPSMQSCTGAN